MPTGTPMTYVAGNGHIPVPMATDLLYRTAHRTPPPKRTGLDWASLAPRCTDCQAQSSQVDSTTGLCPTCRTPAPTPAPTPTGPTANATPKPPAKHTTPRPAKPRTQADRAAIDPKPLVEAYATGLSIPEVAHQVGHANSTVRRALLRAGVTLRDDRPAKSGGSNRITSYPPHLVAAVRDLYLDQGLSQIDTGRRLGIGTKVVQSLMRKHNIPARTSTAHRTKTTNTPPTPRPQEPTVARPDFPLYVVDMAVIMRDTENHPDPTIRLARKNVANAMVALNRELHRYGDAATAPTINTAHDIAIPPPRGRSKLRTHHTELISRYLAGDSTNTLGAAYGVSANAIADYLRRHDITVRPRGAYHRLTTSSTNPTGDTAA